MEIKKSGRINC